MQSNKSLDQEIQKLLMAWHLKSIVSSTTFSMLILGEEVELIYDFEFPTSIATYYSAVPLNHCQISVKYSWKTSHSPYD